MLEVIGGGQEVDSPTAHPIRLSAHQPDLDDYHRQPASVCTSPASRRSRAPSLPLPGPVPPYSAPRRGPGPPRAHPGTRKSSQLGRTTPHGLAGLIAQCQGRAILCSTRKRLAYVASQSYAQL